LDFLQFTEERLLITQLSLEISPTNII